MKSDTYLAALRGPAGQSPDPSPIDLEYPLSLKFLDPRWGEVKGLDHDFFCKKLCCSLEAQNVSEERGNEEIKDV